MQSEHIDLDAISRYKYIPGIMDITFIRKEPRFSKAHLSTIHERDTVSRSISQSFAIDMS